MPSLRSPVSSITRTPEPLGAVFLDLRASAPPCAGLVPPDSNSTRRETIEDPVLPCVVPLPQARCWPGPSEFCCARWVAATLRGSGEKPGVELEWRKDRRSFVRSPPRGRERAMRAVVWSSWHLLAPIGAQPVPPLNKLPVRRAYSPYGPTDDHSDALAGCPVHHCKVPLFAQTK